MNVWTEEFPSEPGYYWVKRGRNGSKEIVYLSRHKLIHQMGTRECLSGHYDIIEWGSKIDEPAD